MLNICHANVRSIQVREQKTCTDNSSGILRTECNKCVYASRYSRDSRHLIQRMKYSCFLYKVRLLN